MSFEFFKRELHLWLKLDFFRLPPGLRLDQVECGLLPFELNVEKSRGVREVTAPS